METKQEPKTDRQERAGLSALRCVIFDLDGTLLDTSPGILECVEYAADKLGYPVLPRQQLLTFIGPPLKDSFMRCYGCSPEEALALTAAYREHYREGALLHCAPYPGIFTLCEKLRDAGVRIAVATSKPLVFSERILCHFHFTEYISYIHCADLAGKLTKTDLIRFCVRDAAADTKSGSGSLETKGKSGSGSLEMEGKSGGCIPETEGKDQCTVSESDAKCCVMVGDTVFDARGAQEAGVPFIGVRYGFGNEEEMRRCPHLGMADSPLEVLDILRGAQETEEALTGKTERYRGQ